jgi:hypothetical protein
MNAYGIFHVKPEGCIQIGRKGVGKRIILKGILQKWDGVDWIDLTHDRGRKFVARGMRSGSNNKILIKPSCALAYPHQFHSHVTISADWLHQSHDNRLHGGNKWKQFSNKLHKYKT